MNPSREVAWFALALAFIAMAAFSPGRSDGR